MTILSDGGGGCRGIHSLGDGLAPLNDTERLVAAGLIPSPSILIPPSLLLPAPMDMARTSSLLFGCCCCAERVGSSSKTFMGYGLKDPEGGRELSREET